MVVLSALVAGGVSSVLTDRALVPARGAGTQSFSDGYACYPGQFSAFRRPSPLKLRDLLAVQSRSVPVGPPSTVCAPATSGMPPSQLKGYLVCYPTTAATLGAAARLTNQVLSPLTLSKASLRDAVCVESDRVDQRVRLDMRRLFVCYRTRTTGTGTRTVRVRDALRTTTESNAAAAPQRGCAAAGESLPSATPPKYLACSTVSTQSPAGSVVLKNRFGYLKAALGPRAAVCVESVRQ